MNEQTKYKHGKPGIGATGRRGLQGESGNGFYIYDVNNNIPEDVFITGEDIIEQDLLREYNLEYKNISYSLQERRLHPKYKEGDTFLIINKDLTTNKIDIVSQLTLNSNHILCTYDYFISSCKNAFSLPISYKYKEDNYIHHKLNIVSNSNASAIYKEQDKYGNAVINGTLLSTHNKTINIDKADDNKYYKQSSHDYIPVIYDTKEYYNVVNNGATLNVYNCVLSDDNYDTLLKFSTSSNTTEEKSLNINTNYNGVKISTKSALNIDNLYIKNSNKGNVEAQNTIFNPYLLLDDKGFCYTLSINDYNANTQCLNSDINKFFKEIPDDISLYHTGYIHTMYNYEKNYMNYYRPNYIQNVSVINVDVSLIRKDVNREYVRDWDLIVDIKNDYIKELLANYTTDVKLSDISNLLDKSVSDTEKEFYKNKTGIICVDNVNKDVSCLIISDLTEQEYTYKTGIHASKYIEKWEYIKIFDEEIYDKLRIYRREDIDGKIEYNQINKEDEDLIDNIEERLSKYIDVSYYSNVIYKSDIKDPIQLAIYDNNANLYSIQEIIQYIQSPDGIRYYSYPTHAIYDTYSNTFNIITNATTSVSSNDEYVEVEEYVFKYSIVDNNLYIEDINDIVEGNITVIYNDDVSTILRNEDTNTYKYNISTILDSINTDTIESTYINNENILSDIISGNIHQVNNYSVPILIEYCKVEDPYTKLQETYYINSTGYVEKRTVPKIDLHIYNDMESLDKFNKVENGIMANQFQFFMKVEIAGFDETNWGLYENHFDNITLTFDIIENKADNRKKGIEVKQQTSSEYYVYIRKLPIDTDIFNITLKDTYTDDFIMLPMNFSMGVHDTKSFYLQFILNTDNPNTINDIHFAFQAANIKVNTRTLNNKGEYIVFNTPNNFVYTSNHLFAKLLPIALTAEYDKNNDDNVITNTGLKQYGSDKTVTISAYPTESCPLKNRYLQDNIESLDIKSININDIYKSLPDNLYNKEWLAKDNDDIYYTYLMLQYDVKNTYMHEDEEVFSYNNEKYLASKYNQVKNNAGIFVEQNISKKLRDKSMISSISMWNTEYKTLYHKESDNPFVGHNNVYGNGYQYLDYNVDNNQYISDGILSLSDVLKIGEYNIFDGEYTENISQPENQDNYTPDILYRSLVNKICWIYPQYVTENNIQLIHARNIGDAPANLSEPINTEDMPYNYMYSIYPRVLYNDEKQENIILMLQKPDIGKYSTEYKVNSDNIYLNVLN